MPKQLYHYVVLVVFAAKVVSVNVRPALLRRPQDIVRLKPREFREEAIKVPQCNSHLGLQVGKYQSLT